MTERAKFSAEDIQQELIEKAEQLLIGSETETIRWRRYLMDFPSERGIAINSIRGHKLVARSTNFLIGDKGIYIDELAIVTSQKREVFDLRITAATIPNELHDQPDGVNNYGVPEWSYNILSEDLSDETINALFMLMSDLEAVEVDTELLIANPIFEGQEFQEKEA